MSCPFNRDVYIGDPFLDWLGSTTGKPLSYYEGRYKKKKTETTNTTSKPEGVTVSTNDTSGSWGFTSQGANINYSNTANNNVSNNNYSMFRSRNANTNTNINNKGSLTHNVFKSGYKKLPLPNYNMKKLPLPNYNMKRLPLPNYNMKRLPLPYTIGGKQ